MLDVASSRQAQEVQAAMVIAKKMPRDEERAYARIMKACQRTSLAQQAIYAYPRGGQTVSGPSIRLAECLAQNWGNIDAGVVELSRVAGESTIMAFAWDLETNSRASKTFTVRHERQAGGSVTELTSDRDIYETVANQGARRLRACIMAIIPGDVIDAALDQCEATLKKAGDGPLIDRVRAMATAMAEYHVTIDMLEKRLGHKLDATTESELVQLRKIFVSIRDGFAPREHWFPAGVPSEGPAAKPTAATPKKKSANARAAGTNMPEVPPQNGTEASKPAAVVTAPADKPKEPVQSPAATPPANANDVPNFDEPDSEIVRLCKRDGVTEAQLLVFCRQNQIAGPAINYIPELSTAKRVNILRNWANILPKVKAITVI